MANRRYSFRGQRPGPRRQTEWLSLGFQTSPTQLGLSAKIQFLSMETAEIAKLPFTITRTIGQLTVWSDQTIATETPMGAAGLCLVNERAVAVGITAFPDPVTENDADFWFLYQPFAAPFILDAAGDTFHFSVSNFDSKAQRKVEEGTQIVGIIANSSASSGMFFIINLRMLIKLH